MKRLLGAPKSAPTPTPNPPPDPRSQDRAARLAALTNAHAGAGSSAAPSPIPSPHSGYIRGGVEVNPLEALITQNANHIPRRPGSGNPTRSPTGDGTNFRPSSGNADLRPGNGGPIIRSPTFEELRSRSPQPPVATSTPQGRDLPQPPAGAKRWPTAAEEKKALEAELLSDALSASLRSGITPEEWRARAEASWRAQAGSSGTARTVRREERLMLEAQELSAQAEEWRLRAEEAWERHLLERDDATLDEMKEAQRRAKKAEGKMMDKLALLAVTEEEENEARRIATGGADAEWETPPPEARQSTATTAVDYERPPLQVPSRQATQQSIDSRQLHSDDRPAHQRKADERLRQEEERREHALEELARRRVAQEKVAKERRAADARKAAKAGYQKTWDSLHHDLRAFNAATPFLAADRPTVFHFETFPWPLYGPAPRDLSDLARERVLEFVYDCVGGYVAGTDPTLYRGTSSAVGRRSGESGGSQDGQGASTIQPNSYHSFPEPGGATVPKIQHSSNHSVGSGYGGGAGPSNQPYAGPTASAYAGPAGQQPWAGPSSSAYNGPFASYATPSPSAYPASSSAEPTGSFSGTFNSSFNAGFARPTGSFAGIGAGSGNYAGVGSGMAIAAGPSREGRDAYSRDPYAAHVAGGSNHAYKGSSGNAINEYGDTGIILGAAPGAVGYVPAGGGGGSAYSDSPPKVPPKDGAPASDGRRSAEPGYSVPTVPKPDLSTLSRSPEDEAARRSAVKAILKTWTGATDGKGGDKFAAKLMRLVEPGSRDAVLEGHAMVVRTLVSELATLD